MKVISNDKTVRKKPGKRKRRMPQVVDEAKVAAKLEMLKAVDDRRFQVAKLYVGGRRPSEIARILNVSMVDVTRDVDIVRKEWIALASQELRDLRAELAAIYRNNIAECEEAYLRSKEAALITRATKVGPGGQPLTSATTKKRDGSGWCRAEIRKNADSLARLHGANLQPPDPVIHVHKHETYNFDHLSLAEMKRLKGEFLALGCVRSVEGTESGDLSSKPV